MRILLTNDDGIHAAGLAVPRAHRPHAVRRRLGRGAGDRPVRRRAFAVAVASRCGCARSARSILPCAARRPIASSWACARSCREPPDLILSGVNSGANIADDVTYSGTVAGAMEGTMLGIRSIALSQAYAMSRTERVVPWDDRRGAGAGAAATSCSRSTCRRASSSTSISRTARPTRSQGTRGHRAGQARLRSVASTSARDGRGLPYYWLRFGRETDGTARRHRPARACSNGYVSVTPLKLDLTAHEVRDR